MTTFYELLKTNIAVNDNIIPIRFIKLNFSLNNISPDNTDNATIPMLFIPKIIELSNLFEFKAFIKKYIEPKFIIPRITPINIVFFDLIFFHIFGLYNDIISPVIPDIINSIAVNIDDISLFIQQFCDIFNSISVVPIPNNNITGRYIKCSSNFFSDFLYTDSIIAKTASIIPIIFKLLTVSEKYIIEKVMGNITDIFDDTDVIAIPILRDDTPITKNISINKTPIIIAR